MHVTVKMCSRLLFNEYKSISTRLPPLDCTFHLSWRFDERYLLFFQVHWSIGHVVPPPDRQEPTIYGSLTLQVDTILFFRVAAAALGFKRNEEISVYQHHRFSTLPDHSSSLPLYNTPSASSCISKL